MQAGVAPFPGAPTGYPSTGAQVGVANPDSLSMGVAAIKADPVSQMNTESGAQISGSTNAVTSAAGVQLYMQQKKVREKTHRNLIIALVSVFVYAVKVCVHVLLRIEIRELIHCALVNML